jgi:hypothetical protein
MYKLLRIFQRIADSKLTDTLFTKYNIFTETYTKIRDFTKSSGLFPSRNIKLIPDALTAEVQNKYSKFILTK